MDSWMLALIVAVVGAVVGGALGMAASRVIRPGDVEWKKTIRLIGGLVGIVIAIAATDGLGGFRMNRYNVEHALGQVELFRVLKRDYPDDYRAVVVRTKAIIGQGGTPADAGRESRPQIQALLKRQLPKASDANLVALLTVATAEMHEAAASSTTACVAYIDGTPFSPTKVFSKAILQRELALNADVLRQTAEAPVVGRPPLSAEALKPIYGAALSSLGSLDETLARNVGQRGHAEGALEQQAYCRFGVALFDQLSRNAPPRQAELLLALMASK